MSKYIYKKLRHLFTKKFTLSPFFGDLQSPYSPFDPSFFHASYIIDIRYQYFHSVNLTLHTVTNIQSRQLRNLVTRWKLPKDSRPKREKSSWQRKNSEDKEKKKCFQEEIVDAPFNSNINIVAEKHLIRNFTCWCCYQ